MTLEKVFGMITTAYYEAKKLEYVRNPLAFALYKVWKIVDMEKGD